MILFHGVTIDGGSNYSRSDFNILKSWRINSVYINVWWARQIETVESNPGYHDPVQISRLQTLINLIRSNGMFPIIGLQPAFKEENTYGWVDTASLGNDYINMNTTDSSGSRGRVRYANSLKYIVQQFPDVGVDLWRFPYHGVSTKLTTTKKDAFYTITQLALLNAIRSVNSTVLVILNPLLQGIARGADGIVRDTGALADQPYYNDLNVMYGYNTHNGSDRWGRICRNCEEWNYNMTSFNDQYKPAKDFLQAHPDAQLASVEHIGLYIHGVCPARPISRSRIAWARAHMETAKILGASWWYFDYTPLSVNLKPESPLEANGTETEIASTIKEFAPIIVTGRKLIIAHTTGGITNPPVGQYTFT